MKTLALWAVLIAAAIPVTGCHWHHHHHRFAEGYSEMNHAQSDTNRFDAGVSSRGG
jgi:hypothetical protein